jgi:hypothetical protein
MRVTKEQLKQIIKEELEAVLGEEDSALEKGKELIAQKVPEKVLKNPKVARELAKLKGKSQKEIAAMLSAGLEESDGGMMDAQRQAAFADDFEAPKTKAEQAKEILIGSGVPVVGAVMAGAIGAMAMTALGVTLTPKALALWALTSFIGWVKGKGVDMQTAADNQYAGELGYKGFKATQ